MSADLTSDGKLFQAQGAFGFSLQIGLVLVVQ